MRTLPSASTWLSPRFPGISDWESSARRKPDGVEIAELGVDPGADVVLGDVGADGVDSPAPLVLRHGEGGVERVRLPGEVEGVDRERPVSELVVGAGVLGEDQ